MTASIPAPADNPELHGQDAALAVVRRALTSGRLAHGWLLTGPPGVGKATLAFRFARALIAGAEALDARLSMPPDHPLFRQVARGVHPDLTVLEAERDPRTGRLRSEITVDVVRAATASLQMTAGAGGYRVAIVDGAEAMNRSAANALLKTLEEPPARSVLILVSHRPGSLAATVRSRCAKVRLSPLPDEIVADALARWMPELKPEERHALTLLAHGSIGRAVARRATGFAMRVQHFSRNRTDDELSRWVPLDELLATSDIISIHTPLTDATRGLIGARELGLMKATAVLVNTSRGAVVDQRALADALRDRRIFAAGLDVTAVEPTPTDDPILALDNCIVLPHVGSASLTTRARMVDLAVDNVLDGLSGRPPRHCINDPARFAGPTLAPAL